jgi:hypothetical protein
MGSPLPLGRDRGITCLLGKTAEPDGQGDLIGQRLG